MAGLRLSALGFDVVLALGSAPAGLRLSELAGAIASPASSVQRVLGSLAASGLVVRVGGRSAVHVLAAQHPESDDLVGLAAALPDPAHAIGIVLRASPVVPFASYDGMGFVVAIVDAPPDEVAALDRQLARIARARPNAPAIMRVAGDDLPRLLEVMVGLRMRVRNGLIVKGRPPTFERSPAGRRLDRPTGSAPGTP